MDLNKVVSKGGVTTTGISIEVVDPRALTEVGMVKIPA